jgi:hypothetical protein
MVGVRGVMTMAVPMPVAMRMRMPVRVRRAAVIGGMRIH